MILNIYFQPIIGYAYSITESHCLVLCILRTLCDHITYNGDCILHGMNITLAVDLNSAVFIEELNPGKSWLGSCVDKCTIILYFETEAL